jgi:hypothetical protein
MDCANAVCPKIAMATMAIAVVMPMKRLIMPAFWIGRVARIATLQPASPFDEVRHLCVDSPAPAVTSLWC